MAESIQKIVNFYFIRHGETVDNITHTLQGQQPGKLTEKGEYEAKLAGQNLKDIQFDFAIVSDLKRCIDTFNNINESLIKKIVNVEYNNLIREVGLGILEGTNSQQCENTAKLLRQMKKDTSFKVEGGESWDEVDGRGRQFWEYLKNKFMVQNQNQNQENILIVSHKGYLNTLMSQIYLSGIKIDNQVKFKNQVLKNCEYIKIAVRYDKEQFNIQEFMRKEIQQ